MGAYRKYRSDGWRWRCVASNGRNLAMSSAAYVAEGDRSVAIVGGSAVDPTERD